MRFRNIVICILFPFLGRAQLQIGGRVLDKTLETPLANSRVTLSLFERDSLVVIDSSEYHPYRETCLDSIYKKQSQVFADSTGYFLFSNLTPGLYKVTAESLLTKTDRGTYYEERGDVLLTVTNDNSRLNQNICLSVFCPFNSTRSFTKCPKCGKDDELRIFVWGLAYYQPGDDGKKFIYTGDCSPPRCRPSKYCVRCKLEF